MAPNNRFSQELHKPLQVLQSWSLFGELTTYQQISWIKGEADALPCHFHISVCLWIMDLDHRVREKNERRLLRWDATMRLLKISYKDRVTNEEVRRKIQAAIGEYDELLTLVKKRKLRWFGHVSRSSGLAKTFLQGTVKEKKNKKRGNSTKTRFSNYYMKPGKHFKCRVLNLRTFLSIIFMIFEMNLE